MIKLVCYRVEHMNRNKYRCEFLYEDKIPVYMELISCPVPGETYEVLLKGAWAKEKQPFLDEISLLEFGTIKLGE